MESLLILLPGNCLALDDGPALAPLSRLFQTRCPSPPKELAPGVLARLASFGGYYLGRQQPLHLISDFVPANLARLPLELSLLAPVNDGTRFN